MKYAHITQNNIRHSSCNTISNINLPSQLSITDAYSKFDQTHKGKIYLMFCY